MTSYMQNLKRNDTNELTKQKLTDLANEFRLCEEQCGEGQLGSLGWTCTHCCILFKMDNQQDLLHSTWNSVECYVAAWMGGDLAGGEWIHAYAWLSPSTVHHQLHPNTK